MSAERTAAVTAGPLQLAPLFWVLWPAFIMSLGWGLRGYIGGGPFGAMIPGVLVALALCMLLGYRREAAALVAAMGAVGVGFGGNMTYGQTIGFIRVDETFAWGLLGLTLKGAIWGLLGGAVLSIALAAPRISAKSLAAIFAIFLVACMLGIGLINEPRLIYFSNLEDRPRDESWAGLLFGALAILAWLAARHKHIFPIAARFALYGFLAGGIGFGGGSLWIALGSRVETLAWLPWWKFMEFSFGFCFGAGLGLCALHLRNQLPAATSAGAGQSTSPRMAAEGNSLAPAAPGSGGTATEGASAPSILLLLVAGIAVTLGVFYLWGEVRGFVRPVFRAADPAFATPIARTLLGYMGLGCLLMLFARSAQALAWHIAASVTFIATVIDLREDWLPEGGLNVHPYVQWGMVLFTSALFLLAVVRWQSKLSLPLSTLFLIALWSFMAVGYAKGLSTEHFWAAPPDAVQAAGGRAAYLVDQLASELIVHAIFTATVIASTLGAVKLRRQHHA